MNRELSQDDLALWRHVTRTVNPYHQPARPTATDAAQDQPRQRPAVHGREVHTPALPPVPAPAAPLRVGVAVDMDRRTARRLKRGELPIDGRLDLHGLTLVQAHAAVGGFLRGAQARGARCVVVVTGKGVRRAADDGEGRGEGKIRRELPHWLNETGMRPLVLAVTEARVRDGGTGAFYVLLRRRR